MHNLPRRYIDDRNITIEDRNVDTDDRNVDADANAKTKSTIMIEGQKDLETGKVDIRGEGLLGSRRKR